MSAEHAKAVAVVDGLDGPRTIYIVCAVGFDYNDEYYYSNDDDAGHPEGAFYDRAQAEAEARKRSIDDFKNHELNDYVSTGSKFGDYVIDKKAFVKILNETRKKDRFKVEDLDEYELSIPTNLTDDQIGRLLDLFVVKFYDVREVVLS